MPDPADFDIGLGEPGTGILETRSGIGYDLGVRSDAPTKRTTPGRPAMPNETPSKSPILKAAWDRYIASLEQMRVMVEASPAFDRVPNQRARAYYQLMEIQAIAYNFAVAPRLGHPRLFHNTAWQTDLYSVGGNGPDFHYGTVFLDGTQTYRLTGRANDSRLLLAQLNSGLPGTPGAALVANYDFADFELRADGSFEIMLSAAPQTGNWIRLDAESGYQWMLFRPTVETWDAVPASLAIERVSAIAPGHYDADEFDEAAVARRIDFAAGFARYVITEWATGFLPRIAANAGGINAFAVIGREIAGEVGSPTAEYVMATFEVDDDEALILEMEDAPDGVHWSYAIFDVWLRSIDFRTRQSSLNGRQIVTDADGGIRVVLSRRDPGIANWLDTGGYSKGLMLLRNYRSSKSTVPNVRRVRLAALDDHLPADTSRVTPQERSVELRRRRDAYRRRHGE
jgi:hypothetical protein